MAKVKKNNKKKIVSLICIVLIIALVAGGVMVYKSANSGESVSLTTISTNNINETVSATGEVTAGASVEYKASTVATVKECFVSVGDEVKEGDVLATFDTSTLDSEITSLKKTYSEAKSAYNDAVKSQAEAQAKLDSVNEQIKETEKLVAKYEKALSTTTTTKASTTTTTTKETTTKATTTTTTSNNTTMTTTTTTTTSGETTTGRYSYSTEGAITAIVDLIDVINTLTNDVETLTAIMNTTMTSISTSLSSGNYSAEAIANAVGDALADAIKQGIIDETQLLVDSGVMITMVETAIKNIDWTTIATTVVSDTSVQLTTAQLQLVSLYAQQEILTLSSSSSIVDAEKEVMEAAESALETVQKAQESLSAGWVASIDGIITECSLVAGGTTSLLSTGIMLENTDTLVATISLGEYDVHKVEVGMTATITTAYGTYDGEVATIAPTATGSSASSILDSVGSIAGISGLSSLTSSGAGVETTVVIYNPDENIIIGFDADVEIQVGNYTDIAVVPVESIILEKTGSYVYLYDEEEGTVTKTLIETGAVSDSYYEVTSGISVGDKIVSTPSSSYEEETFKVKVTSES